MRPITDRQRAVLVHLADHGPACCFGVADALRLPEGTVRSVIHNLSWRGLANPDGWVKGSERISRAYSLTAAGRALAEKLA